MRLVTHAILPALCIGSVFEHLRARRDVVTFDQRGVDALASAEWRCFATRDIGAVFIENPEATFDTSCAEALTPAFILPDGSRSKS